MAAVHPENKIDVGTLLAGKYKVTRELGRGGMAAVYEAEHVDIGKRIAIKVLAAELANSQIVIERFVREARAAASVKSPYIVEVYDSGRLDDGRPFIAMELLEGESLYDRMARVRLIDPPQTVRVIGQVAKGLTKAHAIGIVHRDLKPENIHLVKHEDGDEIAKILDFGLAKFYSPVEADEKTARLTREGAVFGTPAYMSPEQVKGQGNVDQRADLWALGCMAYECLTGRPVWNTDQGVAMTFAAIATAELPTPSRFRPDLPPAFDDWFRKALERDPDRRFQSAKELAEGLAQALDRPPISLFNIGGTPSQIELDAIAALTELDRAPGRMSPTPAPGALLSSSVPGSTPPPAPPARTSEPVDLLRASGLRATDLPLAGPDEDSLSLSLRRRSKAPWIVASVLVLGCLGGGGWFGFKKLHWRWPLGKAAPSAAASTVTTASASDSARSLPPLPEVPKWMAAIEEGQQLLTSGDGEGALRRFKDSADGGGGLVAKSFLDQAKIGVAATGPCKMAALSHPRLGYTGNAGRPAVAATSKGAVVAWTDDHEQPGHEHVYSVLVDSAGRPTSGPRDLTPEADYAMRPELLSVGDRVALLFWDRGGKQPGVKARWLEADGRIGAMTVDVGAAKPGVFSMDRSPDGSGFWVAWHTGPDKDAEDIFLRRLDADLVPQGVEVRATDYEAPKGKVMRASVPTVAVSSANLFVAYTLERDRQSLVQRLRLPASSPELAGAGLPEKPTAKSPHELGDALVVNDDDSATPAAGAAHPPAIKTGGDYPAIACVKDACFLVWHELDKGGARAALVDPERGTVLWRKRFAPKGGHPAVAAPLDGDAEVVFYEGGRVRVASISRDGVGPATTFAKTTGDQPRAWIAPGRARGQWLVSWLDVEGGRTEPFLVRLECRN